MHPDVIAGHLDTAEAAVLALGAVKREHQQAGESPGSGDDHSPAWS
jgi:hypothetical protein